MSFLTYIPAAAGDFREEFFAQKRKVQPPIDDDFNPNAYTRDAFGKLVEKEKL